MKLMAKAITENGKVPVSAQLGQRIRTARRDASMSQGQLAHSLSTTQSAISLYEAGQRSVGIDMLLNVARILNRPLHYFLGEDGDMLYVKDSDIAELIGELEKHPEDLPELLAYWQFLRWRRLSSNGNGRHQA
ncbi:MAG: helix-turn-helix transcriptional regulator [Dehalococcoidia bacterium]|nr:MAG: XRE family transcriptional regulator [bacterium]MCE7928440.1 XRE family transcriptional regulator [Chloroflexi bacterium CFX7]MCK6564219.1 helix-turn-helix domain-containing protein [Dehalococcoidia bacterium]MCL4230663.1 helix-turn-helix domain-containing protein [Dehalococcoidia bacterium]NUQ55444.1 helix-turn-helix transcriptional regulator [Dehalococcoidia bacterium]